jgi:queuine tRNA-ribosyltransferase
MAFELLAVDPCGARRGRLHTPHGTVETPAFMPCASSGAVKTLSPGEVRRAGVELILCNTYHLSLRPGHDLIHELGGLHAFAGWDGPILTDSGGFQVFSMASLRKVTEDGVLFQSHLDGSRHFLSPEETIAIQQALGADITMPLDECPPYPISPEQARDALERTLRWAERSRDVHKGSDQILFGIAQGGIFPDLRAQGVRELTRLDFDGYAVGGLSVGESKAEMEAVLKSTVPLLPADRPRYLMGVGTPEDLLSAIPVGVDLFDCVMPTRHGRTGNLFTSRGRLNIKGARYARDRSPVDPCCGCDTCRHHSRAFLRHLFVSGEILGLRLNTLHNLHYYAHLMQEARRAIEEERYAAFQGEVFSRLSSGESFA